MGQKQSQESSKKYSFDNTKNIYGEPLQSCRNDLYDNGSWDSEGKCSELNGGVHQICTSKIPADFSEQTNQSNWSAGRNQKPHCLCLGAYALYVAKGNVPELNCNAIPENALSPEYINKWNTWNGNELPDQIIDGVDQLYRTCKNERNNYTQQDKYLENLYHNMKKHIN